MSRKGRISHERIEALEKEIADLKQRLETIETRLAIDTAATQPAKPANGYVPMFDRWPGSGR